MADSDKNILITPQTGQTSDPTIVFSSGATGGDDITLSITDDGTITTLSFDGSAGQLFSVSNDLTGTIFAVNDVSGIPSIEVDDDGEIRLAEFAGNVLIGYATDQNTGKLQVNGLIAGTATSAQYADLAEKYATDQTYDPGTVLVIGGSAEVTQCTIACDSAVMGIVSTDPAILMNSEAPGQYIALIGRVPCKVVGPVQKGDILVTSRTPGHVESAVSYPPSPGTVVAKALESCGEGQHVIEVLVTLS